MFPPAPTPINTLLVPVVIVPPEPQPRTVLAEPDVREIKELAPTPVLEFPDVNDGASEPKIRLDKPKSSVIVFPDPSKMTVELSVKTLTMFAAGTALPSLVTNSVGIWGGIGLLDVKGTFI